MSFENPIITIHNLSTYFGKDCVHQGLDLAIKRGEILAIVGGSGSGKTTLLREMLGLMVPSSGSIQIFNKELVGASKKTKVGIQQRLGVLFQQNALFSSLTVLENVSFPLIEHTSLDKETIKHLALLKITMAGLAPADANKYPAELSGGMQKRAALARAIVLDPELIFLDEPTAGLDPHTASGLNALILNLQRTMGLTVVMVTHEKDTLWQVADRVAFLGEKHVLAVAPMAEIVKNQHPLIQLFFDHGT